MRNHKRGGCVIPAGPRWGTGAAFSVLCTLWLFSIPLARASDISKIWFEVYRELNPSEEGVSDDLWKANRDAWAKREEARLEPIVLSILHGERPDTDWTRALFVARAIPTTSICDALFDRLRALVAAAPNGCFRSSTHEEGAVALIVSILGAKGDERVRAVATDLAANECQPGLVVERSVEALRRVGNRQTMAQLSRVPLRQRYPHIDRACILAEKAIDARESGRDLLANAAEELRALTAQYLTALEAKDAKGYVNVHAFGFRRNADEVKITKDVFDSPELADVFQSLKRMAGRESFQIDRDKLEATLIVEGRYKVTYVYEVEGWRIAGIERIAP